MDRRSREAHGRCRYILYEVAQPYLPKGVFDWKDTYGTVIVALVSVVFLLVLRLVVRRNRTFLRF